MALARSDHHRRLHCRDALPRELLKLALLAARQQHRDPTQREDDLCAVPRQAGRHNKAAAVIHHLDRHFRRRHRRLLLREKRQIAVNGAARGSPQLRIVCQILCADRNEHRPGAEPVDDLIGISHLPAAHICAQWDLTHTGSKDRCLRPFGRSRIPLLIRRSRGCRRRCSEPFAKLLPQRAVRSRADIPAHGLCADLLDQIGAVRALKRDLRKCHIIESAHSVAHLQTGGRDGLINDPCRSQLRHTGTQAEILVRRPVCAVYRHMNALAVRQQHGLLRRSFLRRQIAVHRHLVLRADVAPLDLQLVTAVLRREGGRLERRAQRHRRGILTQAAHGDVQPHRRTTGRLGGHRAGHLIIFVAVQHRRGQELQLQRAGRRGGGTVLQKQLPSLADTVALVAFAALLPLYGVYGVNVFLSITQTQQHSVALQSLKALYRRELTHNGTFHNDLAPAAVHRHTGIHHDRKVVQTVYAQPADDPAAEHHLIQKATLVISIGLLRLKIRRGQQFANIIAVALKRQQLVVLHKSTILTSLSARGPYRGKLSIYARGSLFCL